MSSKILSTLKFQEWIYLKRSFMNGCRSRKKINVFCFFFGTFESAAIFGKSIYQSCHAVITCATAPPVWSFEGVEQLEPTGSGGASRICVTASFFKKNKKHRR